MLRFVCRQIPETDDSRWFSSCEKLTVSIHHHHMRQLRLGGNCTPLKQIWINQPSRSKRVGHEHASFCCVISGGRI